MIRICQICVFAFMTFTACGYNNFDIPRPQENPKVVPNADISYIRSLCAGGGIYHISDSLVIAGYVTADDKAGNIYRSFFIEDGTGAVEIRAGMYSLHNVYITGRYVAVKLCGMSASLYNGTLQVGLSVNEGGYGVGYLDNWTVAADYFYPSSDYITPIPLKLEIPQLSPELCGMLVSFNNLKYVPEDQDGEEGGGEPATSEINEYPVTWAVPRSVDNPVPQAAYRTFGDYQGNTIDVYTSGYARFAGEHVPEGRVTLTGIITITSNRYILKLRDSDDVALEIYN